MIVGDRQANAALRGPRAFGDLATSGSSCAPGQAPDPAATSADCDTSQPGVVCVVPGDPPWKKYILWVYANRDVWDKQGGDLKGIVGPEWAWPGEFDEGVAVDYAHRLPSAWKDKENRSGRRHIVELEYNLRRHNRGVAYARLMHEAQAWVSANSHEALRARWNGRPVSEVPQSDRDLLKAYAIRAKPEEPILVPMRAGFRPPVHFDMRYFNDAWGADAASPGAVMHQYLRTGFYGGLAGTVAAESTKAWQDYLPLKQAMASWGDSEFYGASKIPEWYNWHKCQADAELPVFEERQGPNASFVEALHVAAIVGAGLAMIAATIATAGGALGLSPALLGTVAAGAGAAAKIAGAAGSAAGPKGGGAVTVAQDVTVAPAAQASGAAPLGHAPAGAHYGDVVKLADGRYAVVGTDGQLYPSDAKGGALTWVPGVPNWLLLAGAAGVVVLLVSRRRAA